MNYLSIETTREIIKLAETCYPTLPPETALPADVDLQLNPEERALYQKIGSLSPEQLAELQALMLIGREAGGETPEDWDTLYLRALNTLDENTVDYIASKYPLARYLQDGIEKMKA